MRRKEISGINNEPGRCRKVHSELSEGLRERRHNEHEHQYSDQDHDRENHTRIHQRTFHFFGDSIRFLKIDPHFSERAGKITRFFAGTGHRDEELREYFRKFFQAMR